MNRRTAERSSGMQTQQRLLAAAQDAIRDVGLGGATTREITSRASANLASIPYHFGTKDALVAEALIADARTIVDPVLALLSSDQPPAARALAAAGLLNQRFDTERSRVPVLLAAVARVPHSPEVATGLAALWSDLRGRLRDDLAAMVDARQVPAWVEPDAMAALIVAVVSGVVVTSVVDPDGPGHAEIGNQFLALLMAVATPNGGET
jgi:AcrR family transcriptional regulator